MVKGDKIIWDSHFGYEIGYFIKENDYNQYNTYLVELVTGISSDGNIGLSKSEIFPYTKEDIDRLHDKYGYLKEFSEEF